MIGNDKKIRIVFFSFVSASLSERKTVDNHFRPMQVDSYHHHEIEDSEYMSKFN